MAKIDLNTYFEVVGRGGTQLQGLGATFGMPNCLLNLTESVLNLLPNSILNSIRGESDKSQGFAEDAIKSVLAGLRWTNGILEVITEDGIIQFLSDLSKGKMDSNEGLLGSDYNGFFAAIAESVRLGQSLYSNALEIGDEINAIQDCIKSYKDYLDYTGGNSGDRKAELAALNPQAYADLMARDYGDAKREIEAARNFIAQAKRLSASCNQILRNRQANPYLEPQFSPEFAELLEGTTFKIASTEETQEEDSEEIIRLNFGPPKSTLGQLILSVDGLYYDSQSSGLVPVLTEIKRRKDSIDPADKWRFDQDPNIGGRGKGFSTKDLDLYIGTILDPKSIDNTPFMEKYYVKDGFLQDLIGQRNKRASDMERQIQQLIDEAASNALIYNLRQALISESSLHSIKINKRKKQIELAVKIPAMYGKPAVFGPGQVPINDFSYMEGLNIAFDLQKQKSLVLNQEDISGVILPIGNPTFVVPAVKNKISNVQHLFLPDIGKGSFILDGTSSIHSTSAVVLDITDRIVQDGLFAIYNYLETKIETPGSTIFSNRNSESDTNVNYSQLVAKDIGSVFTDGLAIPYLYGIVNMSGSVTKTNPKNVGSFVKLPDTNDFTDWMYNNTGATFETWIHVPHFDSRTYGYGDIGGQASGLYRLILANENTGRAAGTTASGNILSMDRSEGTDATRGLIFGFTRDRRFTQNLAPSNSTHANPIESQCLFIAPTQSFDGSSVGFINRTYYDTNTCEDRNEWHCMKVYASSVVENKAPSTIGLEYCHLALTLDPNKDQIKIYIDGVLMATSSLASTFGIPDRQMPNVPSLIQYNSFEYTEDTVGPEASQSIKDGPKLYDYFTPWILGGGYTDGMALSGNFMGGEYGGIISGLKGSLGATKFYKKPLTQEEVQTNYNVNKDFFKNLLVDNTMWEPLITITL